MSAHLGEWAKNGWLNIVGGCCGSTPEHIRAIAASVRGCLPVYPTVQAFPRYSGAGGIDLRSDSNFTMVGERTNATAQSKVCQTGEGRNLEEALSARGSRWMAAQTSSILTSTKRFSILKL